MENRQHIKRIKNEILKKINYEKSRIRTKMGK